MSQRGTFLLAVAVVACLPHATMQAAPPTEPAAPALPRAFVDSTPIPGTGTTHRARNGEEFRRILGLAQPGDAIVLDAGAVFSGPFKLPRKPGNGWITIRSSAGDRLPAPGTRVDPSHASLMPRLESAAESVITADPGAHHYHLIGLEIRPKAGTFLVNLVEFGASGRSLEALPHHIVWSMTSDQPLRGVLRSRQLSGLFRQEFQGFP